MFPIISSLLFVFSLLFPFMAQAEWVIVLNSGDANLSLIDRKTYQVMKTIPTDKEPHHLMPSPDNTMLMVANAASNNILIFDPITGTMQRRITEIADPYQLAFSWDQKWFATAGNRIDRTDIYEWNGKNFTLKYKIPLSKTPSHLVFSRNNQSLFVTLQDSHELAHIDVKTGQVLWKIKTGKNPAGVWLTPDNKYVLVGITGEDYVEVFDWRTQKSIKKIKTGQGAHNFRPVGDRRHVLLSNRVASSISILDMNKLEKIADITGLPSGPDCMELSRDGKELWVTNRWAKKVSVIDLPSRKLMRTIDVGRSPHGVYFSNTAPWQ